MDTLKFRYLGDTFVEAGRLHAIVERRRTWRERLFSRPWRPWVAWVTENRGPVTFDPSGLSFTVHDSPPA
jgi:hypothetical protein